MPMRADLFNRVSWQIQTRTRCRRVYAWMPLLAWKLPASEPAANDLVVAAQGNSGDHVNMGYRRLSPFSPRVRQTVREIYEDLARTSNFDGLLFHDDVTLSDYEDASDFGLKQYKDWGLPASIDQIRHSDDLLGRWTILKINALDDFAMEMAGLVRAQQPSLITARNMYAQVVLNPKAEVWYSQALENSLAHYDFTAIMAMPYMEKATDHKAFFRGLVDRVNEHPGAMGKVVFELQSVDWRKDSKPIPSEEITGWIKSLYDMGVEHIGWYPDQFFDNHPNPTLMRNTLALKPDVPDLDAAH
jgi:biofilm PGA synthesis lipoprotein PgaB